jgi:putative PIN family toxin of toxin-antitoxin system
MGPAPLRVVVDTNVLVSALLKEGSVPERALHVLLEHAVVLLDARLADEYASVLARPKFAAIDSSRRDALLERLRTRAEPVVQVPAYTGTLDDPDDRAFVEVALAGKADALVTGNVRHFPQNLGFEVLPPAAVLERLGRVG